MKQMISRVVVPIGVLAVILLAAIGAHAAPNSVRYSKHWICKTRVHVITVDLRDSSLLVTPALAYNRPGRRQSFIGFLADRAPLAQITGSYFSLKSSIPIGDIVIGGRLLHRGPVGSALAISTDNTARMLNIPYGWRYSWPGAESALQGGLRLVQNGKYAVYPKTQGFRDPGLFRAATRTAVGLKDDRTLLLVGTNKEIQLSTLAAIMKALGCRDAMTLDGGASTGIAYGTNVLITPGRTISNVLMVVQRPAPKPAPPAPNPAGQPTIGPANQPTIGPAPPPTIGPSSRAPRPHATTILAWMRDRRQQHTLLTRLPALLASAS